MSDEMNMLYLLGALAFGYLLGSIPFGVIFTRMAGLGDIRNVGSGNIGATNVLRTGRKGLAAATLLGDALKGTAAVLIAARWGDQFATLAALGAFLGHLYPVWLKFKGGKGVATFFGVLLAAAWPVGLGAAAVWLLAAALFRYSSLAALLAAVAAPNIAALLGQPNSVIVLAAFTGVLILVKHRANLARLRAGTEPRIGRKTEPTPAP